MRHLLVFCLVLGLLVVIPPAYADPANMTRSIANVVIAEGGYSHHRNDPGGVTLNGVIQRVYDADRDARDLPRRPLTRAMLGTKEWIAERDAIYERRYWEPCAGPPLPRGVDYIVLDMCVNGGIVRGWSMLMKVLGLGTDRPWSPLLEILPAIERAGVRSVIRAYGNERRRFYRSLAASRPTMKVFLTGWLNRETHSRRIAFTMERGLATGSALAMQPSSLPMAKAIEDPEELIP
jgi:lysozyme family protein